MGSEISPPITVWKNPTEAETSAAFRTIARALGVFSVVFMISCAHQFISEWCRIPKDAKTYCVTVTWLGSRMQRLQGVQPSLYDALTCEGSSGAPVIRLHSDSVHYISAGQFVHHGYWREKLDMGMGTVRPPVALPYWKQLDSQTSLAKAVGILYEPVFYWTLVLCDLLHIKHTLCSSMDVFAYTSSFCCLLLSVDSPWFKILNCGFWFHILLTLIVMTIQAGPRYAICYTLSVLIATSQFLASWALMHILTWSVSNIALVILVWLVVLYLERYFNLHTWFMNKTFGSYAELLKYKLSVEMKIHAKRIKKEELVMAQEISTEAKMN